MNPFEMVVAIVAITAIASVIRAKYGVVRRGKGEDIVRRDHRADAEAERLREEVKQLKERVAVLERLATDSSTALDREFEKLKQIDRM
ncbi:hypothetical protein SLG_36110 [Sphingobium sp. SYK-6]|uniref:hypothetical protein n=1 Tax=Sphingobium sp. (strain NBRC 103272 / SYK-6) TaxID=627192 RepID=UPI0002277CA8|nr:hypothetical protein [Sphingobium sp. SYK-6]BAK68286.1 hypothetical protein SLG_36110 [Sphingobium sp. SYK-6]